MSAVINFDVYRKLYQKLSDPLLLDAVFVGAMRKSWDEADTQGRYNAIHNVAAALVQVKGADGAMAVVEIMKEASP